MKVSLQEYVVDTECQASTQENEPCYSHVSVYLYSVTSTPDSCSFLSL